MTAPLVNVTQLLRAWGNGDEEAFTHLMPIVHAELCRLAQWHMAGERAGHTLQATALVNEAYLRLVDVRQVQWQDRAHFFALSARLMRRILIDFARARQYQKRGGAIEKVTFDESLEIADDESAALVALDDALVALGVVDRRKSQVVEMRFFGGLTVEETAEALRVSPETVMRDWKMAKLWLRRELGREATHDK